VVELKGYSFVSCRFFSSISRSSSAWEEMQSTLQRVGLIGRLMGANKVKSNG